MTGWARAVMPLLLLTVACRTSGASPSWDDPFVTADTADEFIKDFDGLDSVITIYEDVPVGHKIGFLHISAQPGDVVTVTQTSTEDILLSFDGTNTEQNVYIQSVLDREKTDSIAIGLQLNGGSTSYFIIQIADVNDNPPMFDGDQGSQISLDVPENQLNDSLLVLTATDSDVDATATLTYSLDTAGYDDLFSLKLLTKKGNPACQLQLLKELDYETRPLYRLIITVTDAPDARGKTQSSSVTVFVNVEDVGDTAPRWLLPPAAYSMDEGAVQGTELFTVEAIDGDTNVNNDIRYSIVSQVPEGIAELIDDTTGRVTLTKELDREDPELSDGFITIVVQAREAPSSDPDQECTIITCVDSMALVTVNDLDDNPPRFEQSSYSVNFPENTTGAIDLIITVNDLDPIPPNNMVSLTLAGAPTGVFGLSHDHGPTPLTSYVLVKDREYMDYEKEDHRVIQFKIVATGDNPAQLTSYANITINLTDIDD